MKKLLNSLILSLIPFILFAQPFTYADTLRGMLSPLRTAYDVHFYKLTVKILPETRSISGANNIHFTAVEDFNRIQIDLFENMKINSIQWLSPSRQMTELSFTREANAVFIDFPQTVKKGSKSYIRVEYEGKPIIAEKAPWDGGFVWAEDPNGRPWVATAVEGIGASLWWPLKDHLSDEPDSMYIGIELPKAWNDLMAVSNGEWVERSKTGDGGVRWGWFVSYPINSYNVSLNIADYAHFEEDYVNASGTHKLQYYVLEDNEEKAKEHFKQVPEMMRCFEKHFGEYPFWKDGYALVEVPYWGMEHQSAVAYGNEYRNNPWGWDFIIVHESGHEWFGNSISTDDHAELWIHEAFTTYTEAVYMECRFGYAKALKYLQQQKKMIANIEPVVGPRDVNYNNWEDTDMYYKGTWLLHTLRMIVNDDELWWQTLKAFAEEHKYQVINTAEVIRFFENAIEDEQPKLNLEPVFRQYLYYKAIPVVETQVLLQKGGGLKVRYRLQADVEDLEMPVELGKPGEWTRVMASSQWDEVELKGISPEVFQVNDDEWLIRVKP